MKLKFLLFIIAILLGYLPSTAQNMVRNPSFESYYQCPQNYTVEYTKRFLPNWVMPTRGTPDYFNRCSEEMVGVPQNFMGSIFPADGNGFIGLVLLDTPDVNEEIDYRDYVRSGPLMPVTITNVNLKKPDTRRKAKPINYREYIQTQLTTTIQPNQLYRISFKYALAQHSTFVSNRLGVVLTDKPCVQKNGVLPFRPIAAIDSAILYSTPGIWVDFADTFRVKNGGQMYLTIGNFFDDSQTQYISNDISSLNTTLQHAILKNQISYYYIDDVKLEPITASNVGFISPKYIPFSMIKGNELSKINPESCLYAILDEVFFDIGQPGTKPYSFYQLNELVKYLQSAQNFGVELHGFTHELEFGTAGASARLNAMLEYMKHVGITENRVKLYVESDLKSLTNTYRFYCEGLPCALYSSLIAIRFFQLN